MLMSCRVELLEESQERQERNNLKIGDRFYYKRIPELRVIITDIDKSRNQLKIDVISAPYISPQKVDIDRFLDIYEKLVKQND